MEFADSISQLITNIVNTFGFATIHLDFDCEPVQLNINQAIPCSLIINEIITNILKHAFLGKPSEAISTALTQKNNKVRVTIRDNGTAYDGDLNDLTSDSILEIIGVLADQLNAEYYYSTTDKHNSFTLEFVKKTSPATEIYLYKTGDDA